MEPYTIIIPAYNEGAALGGVLEGLGKPKGCREVIVVDDGSTDDTAQIAKEKNVKVISHSLNSGYGASLKTGIRAATTEFVIFFDGDGQHNGKDLLRISQVMESFDMVIGTRQAGADQDWTRRPGRKILGSFVNHLVKKKIKDFNSGLRAFRTPVIRKCLHLMPDGFSFSTTSTVTLHHLGYRVSEVPIHVNGRKGRRSSVNAFRDGFRVALLIMNLTFLLEPRKIFFPASALCILSSLLYFILYSIQIRVHVTASMVMLFVTGVLCFFVGIVCEQISVIRREMSRG